MSETHSCADHALSAVESGPSRIMQARKGFLGRPWLGPLCDLKRDRIARRRRRLDPAEEKRLLMAAHPRLYRLVVAALETGCRQGELLRLQWRDVDLDRRELRIQAKNAKDREDRHIPISNRLMAVMEMARQDPAGGMFGRDAYVFGDEVGRRVKSPKKAWETGVLKAHGHKPAWVRGKNRLVQASQMAYQGIDLHFHDLRHEAGSRWLEAGMPLHHVKELLGHADISTTDTYLNAGRVHLHDSMRRMEKSSGRVSTEVAQTGPIDQPLLCNDNPDASRKSLLH